MYLAAIAMGVMVLSATAIAAKKPAAKKPAAETPAAEAPAATSAAQPASASQGPIIATMGPAQVTMDQLQRPLIEAYGLNVLLNLVQLEIARQHAIRAGVKVTPQDVATEREVTIERMFKESNEKLTDKLAAAREKGQTDEADKIAQEIRKDNEQAFEQFLTNQRITRAEFEIVTETNTVLRKIAEPMLTGKITEENLREAFNALYGETVKCRHIQCANLQEIQEVKGKLAGGEPFAKVARDLSRNSGTQPLGGELPAFSLQTQGLPQEFKDAAFALKEGQISEIVQAEGAYHLILLEKRIAPKAVKFEHVKESIRADLQDRALQATVKQLRQEVADQAVKGMVISDPVLKKQWDARLAQRDASIKDADGMRKQMQAERERSTTQPAADLTPAGLAPPPVPAPATAPTTSPAAQ
ncbi:MAG: peptidylprolyl isomerase [Tepidisphaeraceae bacterium]